jgi:hypothetical protein
MKTLSFCLFFVFNLAVVCIGPANAQIALSIRGTNSGVLADQTSRQSGPVHFTSRSSWSKKVSARSVNRTTASAQPRGTGSTPSGLGPWLQSRAPLPAGEVPTSVAMGDFNGDGKMDWVVANGFDDNLWLYRGNGDGTSAIPTILPLKGSSPLWVVTADLRKLGRSDIIVAEHDSDSLGVLLSNGDGTFQPEQGLSVYSNPDFVTVLDVNGDGFPDIVGGGLGCASVLFGDGKGNFQPQITSCSQNITMDGSQPPDFTTFLAFADFNADGKLDLLISNPTNGVEMMTGDGLGHFSSPVRIVSGSTLVGGEYYFFTSTVIDFNGDGCPDAAVGDWSGKVFLFAGDCAGNFKHPASLTLMVGDVSAQLSVADINGDGHPDLVASGLFMPFSDGASSGHMLMVSLGDGQGGFQHAQVYRGGDGLIGFTVGDLNSDGKPDVLAVAQNEDGLYEFMNDGTGGFGTPQGRSQFSIHGGNSQETFPFNTGGDFEQLLADVNADGKKDIIYIDYAYLEKTYSAATSLNMGAQGFLDPVFSPINTDNSQVTSDALGDFHSTGQPDLLVATDPGQPGGPAASGPGNVYLMQNLGSGKFGAPSIVFPHANYATTMASVDLNNDGKQDLLISDPENPSGTQLFALLGNGNGTFQAPVSYSLPSSIYQAEIFVGDFNGDKNTDVLLDFQAGNVVELLGNGDGTFQSPKVLFGPPGLPPFTMVDLNHDGRLDLLVQGVSSLSPQVITYFGQPDGSFAQQRSYNSFAGTNSLYLSNPPAGDFNQDGNVDVIVPLYAQTPGGSNFHWAQFYSGNSDGSLTPTSDIFSLGEVQPIWQVADMDGSGTPSVVAFNNISLSFDVMKGVPAPPIQLSLESEEIIGDILEGTVILNQPSSTDTTVTLQASDPAVGGQTNVLIPAGSTSQSFTLSVQSGFNDLQVLAITASLGNYSTTAYAFDEAVISPLTVEAPNLNFGLQPINTTSPPLTITVINNTTSAVTLTNIVFDPAAAAGFPDPDFSETDNCHTAIAAGGRCSFNTTFTPTIGNKQEVTELDFTDPVSGHVYKPVFNGTGEQAVALLTPSSLKFSSQIVGSVSATQTAFLSNSGTGVLHVSNTSVVGPFQAQNTCSTVQAGTPCQMQIVFVPTGLGSQTGTLTVTADGSTPTQTIALMGTGVAAPTMTISPNSLSFPAQVMATRSLGQQVTLTNPSTQSISISNISITGSNTFSEEDGCPGSLAPGSSCQVSVQFAPIDGSASQGALTITDNATGSPQQVALTGQGLAFAVNSTPTSQTVKSGTSATFLLSISESAPYQESLNFSCIGLPVYASCTFSPATVNLTTTTPATTSLTISTSSAVAYEKPAVGLWPTAATIVATIGIPLLVPRRRQFGVRTMLILLFGTLTTLTLISCSSGASSVSGSNGGGGLSTPAGTYTVTLVGTGNSANIQQKVTLLVQ